ncbi:MAG: hypothetical protein IJ160_04800 [Muribaculaceae bacterium]|nr:hypothetical protein [Muribaculaceae bacterium]
MKKIFLMIAAVVMFTACNGSTATDSTTPSDSVATEQAAEENEEAVVEKMGPCSIESDDLILDVPEGWKATVGAFAEIIMTKEREDHMTQKIEVSLIPHKTAAETVKDIFETGGIDKGADVKMGDKTYSTLRSEGNQFYHAVADWGEEKCLDVTINFIQPEDPVVKAVVESVKLK